MGRLRRTMNRPKRHTTSRKVRRNLRFESLEHRNVLNTAIPFVDANSIANQTATVSSDIAITSATGPQRGGDVAARATPIFGSSVPFTPVAEASTQVTSTSSNAPQDFLVGDTDGDGRDDLLLRRDGDWLISQSAGGGHECQFANVNTNTVAELPNQCVDTAIAPPLNRAPIVVPAGGNLQAAINQAQPGDIIELEAGATYRGRFTIPPKVGDQWIHVRSSRHAELPAPGTRIDPAQHASLMPKIVASGVGSAGRAIDILPGAHHWRFEGIEVTSDLSLIHI